MAALSLAFEQKQAALSSLPEPLSDLALSCLRAERASLEASVASLRQDQRELEDRKGVMETSMVTFETRARAAQVSCHVHESIIDPHDHTLSHALKLLHTVCICCLANNIYTLTHPPLLHPIPHFQFQLLFLFNRPPRMLPRQSCWSTRRL